jgi:hypothetical protein
MTGLSVTVGVLQRLFEQTLDLVSVQPLSERQHTAACQIRALCESTAIRLDAFLEVTDFPQGK